MYRVFSLSAEPTPVASSVACKLITHVGTTDFVPDMLQVLDEAVVPVDLISLFLFCEDWKPVFLGTDSNKEQGRAKVAARNYLAGCFNDDPNLRVLRSQEQCEMLASYVARGTLRRSTYRHNCYEMAGIIDRFSLMTRTPRGTPMTVSLYRSEQSAPLNEGELTRLMDHASLIIAAALKHIELGAGSTPSYENFLLLVSERFPFLSRRERQVCAGILAGLTQDKIAEQLKIKTSSVISHRKRAYARLGVSDQGDLARLWYTPSATRLSISAATTGEARPSVARSA